MKTKGGTLFWGTRRENGVRELERELNWGNRLREMRNVTALEKCFRTRRGNGLWELVLEGSMGFEN